MAPRLDLGQPSARSTISESFVNVAEEVAACFHDPSMPLFECWRRLLALRLPHWLSRFDKRDAQSRSFFFAHLVDAIVVCYSKATVANTEELDTLLTLLLLVAEATAALLHKSINGSLLADSIWSAPLSTRQGIRADHASVAALICVLVHLATTAKTLNASLATMTASVLVHDINAVAVLDTAMPVVLERLVIAGRGALADPTTSAGWSANREPDAAREAASQIVAALVTALGGPSAFASSDAATRLTLHQFLKAMLPLDSPQRVPVPTAVALQSIISALLLPRGPSATTAALSRTNVMPLFGPKALTTHVLPMIFESIAQLCDAAHSRHRDWVLSASALDSLLALCDDLLDSSFTAASFRDDAQLPSTVEMLTRKCMEPISFVRDDYSKVRAVFGSSAILGLLLSRTGSSRSKLGSDPRFVESVISNLRCLAFAVPTFTGNGILSTAAQDLVVAFERYCDVVASLCANGLVPPLVLDWMSAGVLSPAAPADIASGSDTEPDSDDEAVTVKSQRTGQLVSSESADQASTVASPSRQYWTSLGSKKIQSALAPIRRRIATSSSSLERTIILMILAQVCRGNPSVRAALCHGRVIPQRTQPSVSRLGGGGDPGSPTSVEVLTVTPRHISVPFGDANASIRSLYSSSEAMTDEVAGQIVTLVVRSSCRTVIFGPDGDDPLGQAASEEMARAICAVVTCAEAPPIVDASQSVKAFVLEQQRQMSSGRAGGLRSRASSFRTAPGKSAGHAPRIRRPVFIATAGLLATSQQGVSTVVSRQFYPEISRRCTTWYLSHPQRHRLLAPAVQASVNAGDTALSSQDLLLRVCGPQQGEQRGLEPDHWTPFLVLQEEPIRYSPIVCAFAQYFARQLYAMSFASVVEHTSKAVVGWQALPPGSDRGDTSGDDASESEAQTSPPSIVSTRLEAALHSGRGASGQQQPASAAAAAEASEIAAAMADLAVRADAAAQQKFSTSLRATVPLVSAQNSSAADVKVREVSQVDLTTAAGLRGKVAWLQNQLDDAEKQLHSLSLEKSGLQHALDTTLTEQRHLMDSKERILARLVATAAALEKSLQRSAESTSVTATVHQLYEMERSKALLAVQRTGQAMERAAQLEAQLAHLEAVGQSNLTSRTRETERNDAALLLMNDKLQESEATAARQFQRICDLEAKLERLAGIGALLRDVTAA